VIDWLTVHLGASVIVFWIAFTVPLAVLPLSNTVKLVVAVISGSWYQWWMLTGIQRSVAKTDAADSAKKEADHQALTHLALTVDEISRRIGRYGEIPADSADGRGAEHAALPGAGFPQGVGAVEAGVDENRPGA
jgi:hypothetical protein